MEMDDSLARFVRLWMDSRLITIIGYDDANGRRRGAAGKLER